MRSTELLRPYCERHDSMEPLWGAPSAKEIRTPPIPPTIASTATTAPSATATIATATAAIGAAVAAVVAIAGRFGVEQSGSPPGCLGLAFCWVVSRGRRRQNTKERTHLHAATANKRKSNPKQPKA